MQTAAQAKIAPESTSRPDWQFFSDVLGRAKESPPSDREKACARLKELLLESTGNRESYRSLVMKCGASRIGSFVADHPRISSEMVMSALMSKLYDASKGGVGHDSGKPSSGCVIESWDPSKSGIVPYLSTHINWQLKREVRNELCPNEEIVMDGHGNRVSLFSIENLQEKGIDMSSNGVLVRRISERFDDVAPSGEEEGVPAKGRDEVVELQGEGALPPEIEGSDEPTETDGLTPAERERLEEERIDSAARRAAAAPQEEASPEDEVVFADNMAAAEWLALAERRPSRDLLASADRPEYRMFSIALGGIIDPSATEEARSEQLRQLAGSVLEGSCWAHPEYHELVEAVSEWNPNDKSFGEMFPDVVDIVADRLMPGSVEQKELVRERNQEQLVFATFREALKKTKTRQEPTIEIDGEQVPLREVLRPRFSDEVDLDDPGRPDHFLLCHLLTCEFKDLRGTALHVHLRSLGKQFASRTIPGMASILRDKADDLAEWNPSKLLLGEHYLDILEQSEAHRAEVELARIKAEPAQGDQARARVSSPREDRSETPLLIQNTGPLVAPDGFGGPSMG